MSSEDDIRDLEKIIEDQTAEMNDLHKEIDELNKQLFSANVGMQGAVNFGKQKC